MRKKLISIVLVAVMLISMACVGMITTSAADTTGTIYFEMPAAWAAVYDYEGSKGCNVYAHIWVNGGEGYADWQVKAERMKPDKANPGLYYFDIAKLPVALEDGTQPQWDMIIFSAAGNDATGTKVSVQTYDTTLYPECIGKTFKVDTSVELENPMDSSKKGPVALCEGTPSGPHLVLSSLGNVVPSGDEVLADGTKVKGSLLPGETVDQVVTNYVGSKVEAFKKANPTATDEEIAQETAKWQQYAADEKLAD